MKLRWILTLHNLHFSQSNNYWTNICYFNHLFQAQLHGKYIEWMRAGQKVEHQSMLLLKCSQKKKKHTFKVISIVRTCVPLLCVKNTKVTIVAWEYPGAQSDPVSRLLEVWDCRKKDLKTSVSGPENASCHVESFGLWGWGAFWVAPGGGSAAVRRSGVWLCKQRDGLHGGRGLLAAPWVTPHHEA